MDWVLVKVLAVTVVVLGLLCWGLCSLSESSYDKACEETCEVMGSTKKARTTYGCFCADGSKYAPAEH